MAPSRSARIIFLLVLDIVFFFVEVIVGPSLSPSPVFLAYLVSRHTDSIHPLRFVGYAVGSLALVADSFHMLK